MCCPKKSLRIKTIIIINYGYKPLYIGIYLVFIPYPGPGDDEASYPGPVGFLALLVTYRFFSYANIYLVRSLVYSPGSGFEITKKKNWCERPSISKEVQTVGLVTTSQLFLDGFTAVPPLCIFEVKSDFSVLVS